MSRVFVHACKKQLAEVVREAVTPHSEICMLPDGSNSFVRTWTTMAGQVEDAEEHDMLITVSDGPIDAGMMASITHGVYRKQIPVLSMVKEGVPGAEEALGMPHNLLTSERWDTETDLRKTIDTFLTPPPSPGRIFTIDGGDGSGKQTQTAMLVERLQSEGYPVKTLDFPHDEAAFGKIVRVILSGKHGSISEVSPLLFSTLYAMNRNDLKPVLKHWIRRGYNVVLDRYMESNFGHQAAKLEGEERKKLIEQLKAYETRWLGLPESHRVVFLDLDPEVAYRALQQDTTRKGLDMHETAKAGYKQAVRQCFLWCCSEYGNWTAVPCTREGGDERVPRDEVHHSIWDILHSEFVNKSA